MISNELMQQINQMKSISKGKGLRPMHPPARLRLTAGDVRRMRELLEHARAV